MFDYFRKWRIER